MVLDLLKNILSMADNPAKLGKYITSQVRELIGCRMVVLLHHDSLEGDQCFHNLVGICPERLQNSFDMGVWNEIAKATHNFHSPVLLSHKKSGIQAEQLLSGIEGTHSIFVPLEYVNQRVGLIAIVDIFDIQNLQSAIDSFHALAGVLAIELRNANMFQEMETIIALRTRELSDSEKRFRTIIEQATDAMFLSDMKGNIVDINHQACKSLEYTREELLTKNISDFDVQFNSYQSIQEAFLKLRPGENFTFESLQKKKSGYVFPVEINSSKIELEGAHLVIGFVRDITERKQAEQEIIMMGQHYQSLIEKAPDGIILINPNGDFKFVSPAARKMFGYFAAEEIKGNQAQFTHPDDLPEVLDVFHKLEQDPSLVCTIQYRFIDKSGNWKWVESTFSNLLTDPSVEAIVINFRDITDRKQAEEEIRKLNEELELKVIERTNELEKRSHELLDNKKALLNLVEDLNLKSDELRNNAKKLETANKELEAFSYSVSHDLRSPLRAISGFVRILLDDYEKVLDEEGKRICNIINSNATKMGQLIDDLLSFSRLVRSELHHSKIDMQSMAENSVQEFSTNYNLSSTIISINNLPPFYGDATMIRQVWINLISNALKYSSKNINPQIEIGSNKEENEIVYYISDNGVGFSMDYAHKLFGVFQRLHSVAEFEGTGVGLAIVQRIINRHGGRVWAKSELGKGATFYFSLPSNF